MAARNWTPEQRERQARLIHGWEPWKQSTGARTPQGKAISAQNVIVGKRNREKQLEQARQELNAAREKIRKLTGKHREW